MATGGEIIIGSRRLELGSLLRPAVQDQGEIERKRAAFKNASPYPHLEIDGLFDDRLLDLVAEEFDSLPSWREVRSPREHVYRAPKVDEFGPATALYMALVNSPRFVRFLSAVSGIANLIPDVTSVGGGPHETRNGGFFKIHRDFLYHKETGLQNAMVVITYLNRNWDESFGGALELWNSRGRARKTLPEFGRTIIIGHPHRHLHGCPEPLASPSGRHRRSIASYYYINPHVARTTARTSVFLEQPKLKEQLRLIARGATPPAIWSLGGALKKLVRSRADENA